MARKPRVEYEITAEDKSSAALRSSQNRIEAVAGSMNKLSAGLVGAVSAGAVIAGFSKLISVLDGVAKSAKSAGVGAEAFQAWQYAASLAGISAENFSSGMDRVNKSVGDAANGTGSALVVFDRLGIAVRDINGDVRPTELVIRDLADAIKDLKSPAEQSAAAAALFGRGAGPQMARLLAEGSDGLKAYEDRARELGIIIGGDVLQNAEAFNDKMDELRRVITAQTANAILGNADALTALADAMGKVVSVSIRATSGLVSFVEFVGEELAARIGGIAANDVPRLTGALRDAQEKLSDLESGSKSGQGKRGLQTRVREAREEVERLELALTRANDMVARGLGPVNFNAPPPRVEPPAAVEAGSTSASIKAAEDLAKQELRIREQLGRAMSVLREKVIQDQIAADESEFQLSLARAAGFADIAAQEAFARDEQLYLAKVDRRNSQFEEELAIELGYKSSRDMAIQEMEEAHQDAMLQARTRHFGRFQGLAVELSKFETKTAREKSQFLLSQAQTLTAGMASNSKTMFNINKAASIADAVMNTATGISAALRLGPKGIPLAAIIGAMGAAQIATISSTQFGGASSGLTSSGPGAGIPSIANEFFTAPTVSSEERNRSTIRLEIVADDSEIARTLIRGARVVADDEDDILFGSRSRQSIELSA